MEKQRWNGGERRREKLKAKPGRETAKLREKQKYRTALLILALVPNIHAANTLLSLAVAICSHLGTFAI